MLRCKDASLYTGYTTDMARRLAMHNSGKGAKYTSGRRPCRVVYLEEFNCKSSALQREYAVKQLSRKEKVQLIRTQLKEVIRYEDSE